MKRTATINSLIFFLTLAVFYSCTKKQYTPIQPEVKAKFNYQPGTYWIYSDRVTGETDSFAVKANTVQNTNVLNESIFIDITRYNLAVEEDTTILKCVLSQDYIQTYALGTTLRYPFRVEPIVNGDVLEANQTYTINGQTFTGVAKVVTLIAQPPNMYIDTFYMNADAGIVKLIEYRKIDTIETTKVLELQRWNIIR